MKTCKCGTEIDFIRTLKGKSIPVEGEYQRYDECKPGTVLVTDGGNVILVKAGERRPSIKGREPHHAYCPYAAKYRKPTGKRIRHDVESEE